ncbi:FecCD family ABC transporter permease [Faecalibaculum rodentium]|jgi:iron complex transport system permease protein|uniref:FecCD family ABC transporter permease n=1 Tax=Faecalibaculum rodentium TaxID=1702221 RepID=UPI001C3D2FEE|nr:iron ABC transporter permease [Faecalibaculum rodentium]
MESRQRRKTERRLWWQAGLLVMLMILALAIGSTPRLTLPVFLHVRLPRMLGCLLAGSGLAVAGMILQTVLANPLASPNILGIQSGAGLMTVLSAALFPAAFGLRMPASFLGAFLASLFVMLLAKKVRASRSTIVLAGLAVSQIFSTCIDLILTLAPDSLTGYTDFRIGSLAGITLNRLLFPALCIVGAIVFTLLCARQLELMQLGQRDAQCAGLDVNRWMLGFLALASLLAGSVISFTGMIGFVGLIVPHMVRRLSPGPLMKQLVSCLLLGPAFLLLADLLARTVAAPYEIPAGILLTLAGGPYFLSLLLKGKGHGHD